MGKSGYSPGSSIGALTILAGSGTREDPWKCRYYSAHSSYNDASDVALTGFPLAANRFVRIGQMHALVDMGDAIPARQYMLFGYRAGASSTDERVYGWRTTKQINDSVTWDINETFPLDPSRVDQYGENTSTGVLFYFDTDGPMNANDDVLFYALVEMWDEEVSA